MVLEKTGLLQAVGGCRTACRACVARNHALSHQPQQKLLLLWWCHEEY